MKMRCHRVFLICTVGLCVTSFLHYYKALHYVSLLRELSAPYPKNRSFIMVTGFSWKEGTSPLSSASPEKGPPLVHRQSEIESQVTGGDTREPEAPRPWRRPEDPQRRSSVTTEVHRGNLVVWQPSSPTNHKPDPQRGGSPARAIVKNPQAQQTTTLDPLRLLGDLHRRHHNLKDDLTKYFIRTKAGALCFRQGTEMTPPNDELLKVRPTVVRVGQRVIQQIPDESKNQSKQKREKRLVKCICRLGWHGPYCGVPTMVYHSNLPTKERLTPRETPRRIINAINVNHEFDLLHVRFQELSKAVDLFLVCESNFTAYGERRPLRFLNMLLNGTYEYVRHKILYVLQDHFPDGGRQDGWIADDYLRTFLTRNGMSRVMGLRSDDVFLINDADEIPAQEGVLFLKLFDGWTEPFAIHMRKSLYGFFWKQLGSLEVVSGCTVGMLRDVYDNDGIRLRRREYYTMPGFQKYENDTGHILVQWSIGSPFHFAGWHCSWCFTPEGIHFKLISMQNGDFPRWGDYEDKRDLNYIRELIQTGGWFDGSVQQYPPSDPKEHMYAPKFMLENYNHYRYLLENPYSKPQTGGSPARAIVKNPHARQTSTLDPLRSLGDLHHRRHNLKDDTTKYFVRTKAGALCFRQGTEMTPPKDETLKVKPTVVRVGQRVIQQIPDESKNQSKQKREKRLIKCVCRPGWHGPYCGVPTMVYHSNLPTKERLTPRETPRRIINAINVNHEFDLLHVRFQELSKAVDLFLVCESNFTAYGERRPLRFLNMLLNGTYEYVRHKILYVLQDHFPDGGRQDGWIADDYLRTFLTRNGMSRVMGLRLDDVFLINDADEIPAQEGVLFLKLFDGWTEPFAIHMRKSLYGFFWKQLGSLEVVSGCTVGMLRDVYDNDGIRLRRRENYTMPGFQKYENDTGHILVQWSIGSPFHFAGWHCSWCFTPEGIHFKLISMQNGDFPWWGDYEDKRDLNYIRELIQTGGWFDGSVQQYPPSDPKEHMYAPKFMLENYNHYRYLLENPYSKPQTGGSPARAIVKNPHARQTSTLDPLRSLGDLHHRRHNLKDDTTKYFVHTKAGALCFRQGTEMTPPKDETLKVKPTVVRVGQRVIQQIPDESKNQSKQKREKRLIKCVCRPGWHGPYCGVPTMVYHSNLPTKERLTPRETPRRIINGINVNHEFDLLHVRFQELSKAVDLFLVCESNFTTYGERRPLRFLNMLLNGTYEYVRHKILYVFLDHFPDGGRQDGWIADDYLRTFLTRNGMSRVMGLRSDDVFLINDADEIPAQEGVLFLKLFNGWTEPFAIHMRKSLYGFFWKQLGSLEVVSGCTVGMLRDVYDNDGIRLRRRKYYTMPGFRKYENDTGHILVQWSIGSPFHFAGWHCSWCFTPEGIHFKLISMQNGDFPRWGDYEDKRDLNYIRELIRTGGWFDGSIQEYPPSDPKEHMYAPKFMLENYNCYRYLLENPYSKQVGP